jgi:hypothetical protein
LYNFEKKSDMQRNMLLLVLILLTGYVKAQIIVDHRAVDDFGNIPSEYIAKVKKMMVAFPGESHSEAMRYGMKLLEDQDSRFACNISTAEAYTDQHVRVEDYGWIGELEWFTWYAYPENDRPYPVEVQIKYLMKRYYEAGYPVTALGFTWCYDMVIGEGNETEGTDPVYGVHWYGASNGGPDGDKGWGLDEGDYDLTQNRVSLQTYFDAMEDYIDWSNSNGYGTKVVFTTGTVDYEGEWWGEGGWQGHIKHEAIRDYVKADPSRILFDYADILCYDDDGTTKTQTWNGHTYPSITSKNEYPRHYGHIADAGAIRLAKAQWWLLARLAGWGGGITSAGPSRAGEEALQVVAADDSLTITIREFPSRSTVRVFDVQGSLKAVRQLQSSTCSFQLSGFSPGIYVVVLSGGDAVVTRQVVIS